MQIVRAMPVRPPRPSRRPTHFVFEVVVVREAFNPGPVLDVWDRTVAAARHWADVVLAEGVFDPEPKVPLVRLRARVSVPNAGFGQSMFQYDEDQERREAREVAKAAFWGLGREGLWTEI